MGGIKRNVFYNVTLSISQVLFPLLVFPYVSRVLGPVGIGEIAFVDSITQWCILVAALGIPVYGVREIAKLKHDPTGRSKLFSELIIMHIVTTVLLLVVFIIAFNVLDRLSPYRELFWIGAGILFLHSSLIEWLFQGMGEFSFIALRTIAIRVVTTIAVFCFVNDKTDIALYYSMTLGGTLVNVFINIWSARKFVHFVHYDLRFTRHIKPLFYIFSFAIITSVYTLLDTMFLGIMLDKVEVGYYSTALRVVKLVITVLVAVSTVMIASLSFSIHQGRQEESIFLLQKSFAFTVFMGVPLAFGLFVVAPDVVSLFAGKEFGQSVIVLRFLVPTILMIGLSNIFGMQVLNTTNNERLFLYASLVGMAISVVTNLTLVPVYRATGTAAANVLTEAVVCIVLIVFAKQKFPFHPDWRLLFKAIMAALPMLGLKLVIDRLNMPILLELFVIFGLSGITYFSIQHFIWHNLLVGDLLRLVSFGFLKQQKVG